MSNPSHNEVTLIGTLGADPEIRGNGDNLVASIALATNESWRDRATGETKERTDWHDVVVFGKVVQSIQRNYRKGMVIMLKGTLRKTVWEDDQGQKRSKYEVHVSGFSSKIQIVDWKDKGPQQGSQPSQSGQRNFGQQKPEANPPVNPMVGQSGNPEPPTGDDPIPF
ncbi:single-stranded DNA-binding protein [Vibrio mediterranei]|uniref:single-stranded DNA-binding protein n=1 Tax=Vibrio mediterranei TaxID=689 RepID=UPI004067A04A